MKFAFLVWNSLKRRKLRNALTILSIFIAFLLFAFLSAVEQALSQGIDLTDDDRLIVRHRVSIIQPLPERYKAQVAEVDGVTEVTHATWFGGTYQDPRNFFAQMAVEPEPYLALYPEFILSDEEKAAWLTTRTGAVAGRATADRFGWEVGDRIPIQATIWLQEGGKNTWEFDLVGIYEGAEPGTDTTQFLFRYDYFDEARGFAKGFVGWFMVRVADAERAPVVARTIDGDFANSPAETKAEPEGAFVQAFANQVGDIGAIVVGIAGTVFLTMLLVAGNTMAQSVRERVREFGVLKSLGYSNNMVVGLVLAESVVLAVLGGFVGLYFASGAISAGDPTGGFLPLFHLPGSRFALGVFLVVALGIAAGLLPAIRAMRLSAAAALRGA